MATIRNLKSVLFNHRPVHDPLRASVRYLVVGLSSHLLASQIGSLSEYRQANQITSLIISNQELRPRRLVASRFPHTLLTTALHLALALASLMLVSVAAQLTLKSSRLHSTRARLLTPNAAAISPFQFTSLGAFLAFLAAARPSHAQLSPLALTATLAAVAAALLEARGTKVANPAFWAAARLLPLVLAAGMGALGVGPRAGGRGATRWTWAAGLAGLLVTGPGLEWTGSGEGYVCAAGYAMGALGWVWAVRAAQADTEGDLAGAGAGAGACEGEGGASTGPGLGVHLAAGLGLVAVLLLPSGELSSAAASGHLGFFTEPGFWAQEWGIAVCGLASLAAFWSLITVRPSLPLAHATRPHSRQPHLTSRTAPLPALGPGRRRAQGLCAAVGLRALARQSARRRR